MNNKQRLLLLDELNEMSLDSLDSRLLTEKQKSNVFFSEEMMLIDQSFEERIEGCGVFHSVSVSIETNEYIVAITIENDDERRTESMYGFTGESLKDVFRKVSDWAEKNGLG